MSNYSFNEWDHETILIVLFISDFYLIIFVQTYSPNVKPKPTGILTNTLKLSKHRLLVIYYF